MHSDQSPIRLFAFSVNHANRESLVYHCFLHVKRRAKFFFDDGLDLARESYDSGTLNSRSPVPTNQRHFVFYK